MNEALEVTQMALNRFIKEDERKNVISGPYFNYQSADLLVNLINIIFVSFIFKLT